MKKYLRSFCRMVMALIITCQSSSFVHAANVDTSQSEFKIKAIVEKYFDNELKSIQTSTPVDSSDLIKSSKFKQQVILNNKLKAEWYKKIDENLINYKLYLDYNSIDFKGNKCIVNLDKGVDLVFKNSSDITQKARGEKHVIVLNNYGENWYIANDLFEEDGLADNQNNSIEYNSYITNQNNEDSYVNNKIKGLTEKYNKIDSTVKEYKGTLKPLKKETVGNFKIGTLCYAGNNETTGNSRIGILSYTGYNGTAAVNYAAAHYNDTEDYPGGDCTNFVSKCINAGGIPTSSTWKPGSNAWIRVIELRDYLVGNGIASQYTWLSSCKQGDLVQFQKASNLVWGHSAIISYIGTNSQVFISCHSSAHYNYALFNYYPTSSWSGIRYLKLTP